jgi:hypothetical protein
MYSKEHSIRARVRDLIGSGLLGGAPKRRAKKGGAVVNSLRNYEGGAGFNPMSMLSGMFNPMSMLSGMMPGMGSGVRKQRIRRGGGVVNSLADYEGGGVVNSLADYEGGGIGDSLGIPRWINWFGIGKKPKSKRAPSARGQMISKLMREKGMSLGEASKYLKQQGH